MQKLLLMQENDLFEYRDKIIDAFKDSAFLSGHLKKTDNAAYYHVLEDVKDFIQKIKSMSEKINLSLFEDFLTYHHQLIHTENPDKNKEFAAEIKDGISNLKDRIKKMNEIEKINRNAAETLKIIKETLDYNKNPQKKFQLTSKVDQGKSETKLEKSIAKIVKLKNEKIAVIKKEEKNMDYKLFKNYFTNYQSPSDMYKK